MGTVASLAREIERGLRQWHPGLRKTLAKKLAPTIAAAIQTQTAVGHAPADRDRAGGHALAVDCPPTAATTRDDGLRWAIEPMFSDFNTCGFGLEDTQLRCPDRVDYLGLILSLAMHWCIDTGRRDALESPTPLEQKAAEQTDPDHWIFRKLARSCLSWFQRGLRKLLRFAELGRPLPCFAPSG